MELPRSHGRRPRSIDLIGDDTITIKEVLDIFDRHTKLREHQINLEAVFQIGIETFNSTMTDEEAKNSLLAEEREFRFNGKNYRLQAPRAQPIFINIRAVPSEASNQTIAKAIEQYKAGNIVGIRKMYHRGTNLHNGFRSIAIIEYKPGMLPTFIRIDGASCKVFEPKTKRESTAEKTCHKCHLPGHLAAACQTIICNHCRENGHIRSDCVKLKEQFPAIESARKTEEKQKQTPVIQEGENEVEQKQNEIIQQIREAAEELNLSASDSDSDEERKYEKENANETSEHVDKNENEADGFQVVRSRSQKRKRRSAENQRADSKRRNENKSPNKSSSRGRSTDKTKNNK